MTERTEDAQTNALRAFLLVCALGEDWRGRLVLVRGLGAEGRAVSVATSIAGGACLAVEADAEACRAALRAGACDFVVNTVDEALRVLKNEIRKQKPVSVALQMDVLAALDELAARGVAPQAYVARETVNDAVASRFAELGAKRIGEPESGALTESFAAAERLALHEFRFDSAQALREFDRRLAAVTAQAGLRSRWAARAPDFFYRERPYRRVAWLTAAEAALVSE